MSLHKALKGDRLQIVLFGKRNAGKSSVLNAMTGQNISIVSDVLGTTTDPVSKAMEILPLGPCMFTDTPGLDDYGELGQMRVKKALDALKKADVALIVIDISIVTDDDLESKYGIPGEEEKILIQIKEKNIPYIFVLNKIDSIPQERSKKIKEIIRKRNKDVFVELVSAKEKIGFEELKDAMIKKIPADDPKLHIIGDFIESGDIVVLVVPVDSAAPKGRLIMPQQQVIRDILDNDAVAVVTQIPELSNTLNNLSGKVKMVVTDSQAFKEVAKIVPKDLLLTSFSILFANHKGDLHELVKGVSCLEKLKDGDKILIVEGCTHRRQCDDIGTVKIPRWLKEYTGKSLVIETCSGIQFPEDLHEYSMIIHCGGCTLNEREMKYRINFAKQSNVPILNYGIFIAYVNGILKRSIEIFPEILQELEKK